MVIEKPETVPRDVHLRDERQWTKGAMWEILTEYKEKMFTKWLSTGAGCGCEIPILGGFQKMTKQDPGQPDAALKLSLL